MTLNFLCAGVRGRVRVASTLGERKAGQQVERLLEREEALAAIDELITSATSGDGSALLIEAAAGLGKSALLAVARERATRLGLRVASARGGELERDFPFGVVRQLLEPVLAGATEAERQALFEGAARLTAPLVGGPRDRATADRPSSGTLGQPAGAAMHGLYWLVVNLAERGPLLLCVDDAHWGDSGSLRWLHYFVRRLEGLPLAVIVATRPGEPGLDGQLLEAVAAEPRTRVTGLEPFTREGSDRFVRDALATSPEDEFCGACHAASGGNPFFLEELTTALARDSVAPTAASVPLVRELVPDAVARSLILRMASLPKAAGSLARAVAILGSGASLHCAAALAELDESEAAHGAAALAAAAIVTPGLPLDFVHPLVRATVYDNMPEAERTIWHARAARLLAAGGARSERVAAQLLRAEAAGDPWVVAQLREAAADAVARADAPAAIGFLRRAFVEPVPASDRLALLQELSRAGFVAADSSVLDGLGVDAVLELAADPEALRACALYLVMGLWVTGRRCEAVEILERALSAAMEADDHDLAIRLGVRRIMLTRLRPGEALRRLEPYHTLVEADSFAGRLVEASVARYGSLIGRPACDTAEQLKRAFAGGRLVTELQDDGLILNGHVLALLRTDELELCERIIEQILSEGRHGGPASAVANGLYLSAYLAHMRGALIRAEGDARAAATAIGEAGGTAVPTLLLPLLVDTLTDRGKLAAAERELAGAGMVHEIPDHWWFGPVLWSRGYLRLAQGRTREGVEDLLEFGRRFDRDGLVATVTRPWASQAAPLVAQFGDRDEARRLAERELDEARAWGTPRTIGQALRGLGLVAGGPDGIELLRDSVGTLESSPARLEHARALIDLGATLRRTNQRSEARDPLRRGLDLAHRCGARPLVARANQELHATGAKPRKLVLTGVEALTASERRIAEMATEGLTNREIAQGLFVTIKTVETHMGHVFQKLDVSSRKELGPVLSHAITEAKTPAPNPNDPASQNPSGTAPRD